MDVGAGLYMYDVIVKKLTFAISSPDEFPVFSIPLNYQLIENKVFMTSKKRKLPLIYLAGKRSFLQHYTQHYALVHSYVLVFSLRPIVWKSIGHRMTLRYVGKCFVFTGVKNGHASE